MPPLFPEEAALAPSSSIPTHPAPLSNSYNDLLSHAWSFWPLEQKLHEGMDWVQTAKTLSPSL